ncbi:MAG: penicillin-binding protein, partial [Fusobacterium gastrosuis]|nr:penicillin-binding protein [Fusobacterium gastrosuis]
MVEIHFYKETELKYSVYANSLEDVIKAPADYYAEYTVDMVITDVKFLNPIYINGELREMTREEKVVAGIEVVLEEGEIIKRKK